MFSRPIRRGPRSLSRQAAKALKSTLKGARAAVRHGNKAVRQAAKAVRQTTKTAKALKVAQARRSRPPGRFLEVDGVRVHYIARGRGRPVVLVHGNGTMAEDFVVSSLVDRLARHYRVIAVDRPGFGHTDRPRWQLWTAAAQARLLHHVLERLNVERPVIVGHSWGTLVALALAAGISRELRGLVLLSGYYYPGQRADVTLTSALAIPGFGDLARSLVPASVSQLVHPHVFRQAFWPQPVPARFRARFPVETAAGPLQQRASAEDAAALNAAAALLQPHYARLPVPLAIITGDRDAVVDAREHSCRLHRQAPESTLLVLPGQGHMIHYSARAEIGRAVDALMNRAGRRTGTGGRARPRRLAVRIPPNG